jgi:hypothetical protein
VQANGGKVNYLRLQTYSSPQYFEVNYGGDGLNTLIKWFGHWHGGSKEAEVRMLAQFKKKRDRLMQSACVA